jgi:hypothetical protein
MPMLATTAPSNTFSSHFKPYLASVQVRQVEGVPGELGRAIALPLDEVGVLEAWGYASGRRAGAAKRRAG